MSNLIELERIMSGKISSLANADSVKEMLESLQTNVENVRINICNIHVY
jgi:hypothetical protein